LEKLNFQATHTSFRKFDSLFLLNVLLAQNVAPLSSKQSAIVFLLETFVTSPGLIAPLATDIQLDVFLLHMQLITVNLF
jgi:hypothetical protein